MQMTNWKHWAVGGVAALTIMAGAMWAVDSVSAAELEQSAANPAAAQTMQAVGFRDGRMGHGNQQFGALGQRAEVGQQLLAAALGISVEELEAAQATAQTQATDAALAQAVADGTLTQAQADAIKELQGLGNGRYEQFYRLTGDHDEYLAGALGITVEELQAARDEAVEAGIAQAVADGTITQEQADEMLTGMALKDYLKDELSGVFESAIQKAVTDGVITQEQADEILERQNGFFGGSMRGGFPQGFDGGMRGDFGGHMRGGFPHGFDGGMRGGFPGGRWDDSAEPETQSGSLYVTPGSQL